MSDIVARFFKFVARKVATKQLVFIPSKGAVRHRNRGGFISIKDPFIKQINYGRALTDKKQFQKFVEEFSNLLEATHRGEAAAYMF